MKKLFEKHRFIKFAIVGISGTIVDFAIFNFLSILISLPIILSSIFSFCVAVVNNFYWNRNWTYPESQETSSRDQLTKFFIVSLLGLIFRTFLFSAIEGPTINLVENQFGNLFSLDPVVVGHNLALASVIIIILFWNYFANRFWTYKNTLD